MADKISSGGDGGLGPPQERIPRQRKRPRGVALLPALFTLGNCMSGFASLNYASRGGETTEFGLSNYAMAGWFIFLAMVFDMFDGFVARLTRSASDFGAELDSLADMVSFGVAPAFLSLHLIGYLMKNPEMVGHDFYAFLPGPFSDNNWLRLFWMIGAVYVSCTALRLARFNVMNKHDALSHMSFRGMPSPGAAATVAATVIFFEMLRTEHPNIPFNVSREVKEVLRTVVPYLLPLVLLIAALLMVSRFQYTHLINRFLRGRRTFRKLVGLFLLAMIVMFEPQLSAVVAIYVYALSAPVAWAYRKVTGKAVVPPMTPVSRP